MTDEEKLEKGMKTISIPEGKTDGSSSVIGLQERVQGVLYGFVSGVICPPVTLSFAAIIFRDPAFGPYMGPLSKLVLVSSVVHQICFGIWSSMPFAIGQVQDAGLIFLSAMASLVVFAIKERGGSDEEMLATACVVLPLCTCLLGAMLVLIGKLRLASLVHYLPMPVIGGYLAYIGFFCGEAGLSMMAGVEVTGVQDWYKFFNRKAAILMAPGIICGVGILVLARKIRHMATLPVCMFSIILIFYIVMYCTGHSIGSMREYGWFDEESAPVPFQAAWKYISFGQVNWSSVVTIFPLWVAMVLVVAFSSSLDVAAIEMEARRPFDYNRELQTVGISNFFSGLTGGFTGSYIFSQTLFNLRMGVRSRMAGIVVTVVELLVVLLPVSPLAFVPKCFFGALLVMIASDLISEWLLFGHSKMSGSEYSVALLTFFAIQVLGVESGLAVGVLGSMVAFIVVYARIPNIKTISHKYSSVLRTFEAQSILANNCSKHLVVILEGYIFFGSAVKMLKEVKHQIGLIDQQEHLDHSSSNPQSSRPGVQSPTIRPRITSNDYTHALPYRSWAGASMQEVKVEVQKTTSLTETNLVFPDNSPTVSSPQAYHYLKKWANKDSNRTFSTPLPQGPQLSALEWLILDFSQVSGIDTTAARVCFLMLKQTLQSKGIALVFASLNSQTLHLFKIHMVIGEEDKVFPTVDKALEWIEEQTLEAESLSSNTFIKQSYQLRKRYGTRSDLQQSNSPAPNVGLLAETEFLRCAKNECTGLRLSAILRDYLEFDQFEDACLPLSKLLEDRRLEEFFESELVGSGHVLIEAKSTASAIRFISHGLVELQIPPNSNEENHLSKHRRLQKISAGGVFGEIGFFLKVPQYFRAVALSDTHMWRLSRLSFAQMQEKEPQLCVLVQNALLRSLCLQGSSTLNSQQ